MTNSEAIKSMQNLDDLISITAHEHASVKMAINALEENNKLKEEIDQLKSKLSRSIGKWDFVINGYGELKEFICDCGHGSLSASNYCPKCGSKMDNSDYEIRIKQALKESVSE